MALNSPKKSRSNAKTTDDFILKVGDSLLKDISNISFHSEKLEHYKLRNEACTFIRKICYNNGSLHDFDCCSTIVDIKHWHGKQIEELKQQLIKNVSQNLQWQTLLIMMMVSFYTGFPIGHE